MNRVYNFKCYANNICIILKTLYMYELLLYETMGISKN